jgi:hypothetical protein
MRRGVLALTSLLAGGSLFATCEARLHDSIVDGTKFWFLGLFDPANLEDLGILDLDGTDDAATP